MKLAIISLGCPKNQVDADVYCRALLEAGHTTVPQPADADVVLINTCGFIESAKEEAIANILDCCALKEQKPDLRVVVTGCLAERYRHEIAWEIPEVDAVVGIGANVSLPQLLQQMQAGQPTQMAKSPLEAYGPKSALPIDAPRVISTPGHYAWLKIAEGCSNNCAYCAIPSIRGPMRSRSPESVLREAAWLAEQGVKELVLVAQDVTAYGTDLKNADLPRLLEELDKVDGIEWIRLLYTYPERIDRQLLETIKKMDKVLHYFDIPIQHCNDTILQSMRRRGGTARIMQSIEDIRHFLPDAILRTSLIVGYPGETEEQFEELCTFVQQTGFDRLGCFAYSAEEGTVAAALPGQIAEEIRQERADLVMQLQNRILLHNQEARVGQTVWAMCDGYDEEEGRWLFRDYADAPEIDLMILVDGDRAFCPGELCALRVTGVEGLDLCAEPID